MDLTKYKKMFVDEAREHLALAGQHLVALEKSPQEKSLINELFRNAHSIKGMAASLGYEEITDLAHVLEDLLDLCRSGKRTLNPQDIDLLLRAVDFIERMVDQVDSDAPIGDPSALASEIQQLMASDSPAESAPSPETGPLPVEEAGPGTEIESPADTQPEGATIRIIFRVASDSVSPGARGYLAVRKLSSLGTLARLRPEIEAIKSGRYGRVVEADLDTDRTPDQIAQELSGIPEILDVRIEAVSTGKNLIDAEEPPAPRVPSPKSGARAGGQSNTVRVRTEVLDRFVDAVGELILNKSELREIARDLDSEALLQGLARLEASLEELKRQAMNVRLTPLERVLAALPRQVRDLARSREKEVRLEVRGADLELDRAIVEALNEPLIHLVRNAIDHGVEAPAERMAAGKEREGRLLIEAYREKDLAIIHVEDDGRGVDVAKAREAVVSRGLLGAEEAESADEETVLHCLFMPGMSTAAEVSEISGRGVGLDAVKQAVQALGGAVSLQSRAGSGTQFTLRIPFSAAILRALIVRVGEELFAIPIPKLHRALEVKPGDLMKGSAGNGRARFCRIGAELLPARSLAALLGFETANEEGADRRTARPVIVTDTRRGRTALLVDGLAGEEEVFVKPLGKPLTALASLSGITVLGNGRPVFVIDPYGLGVEVPAGDRRADDPEEEIGP